jgi:hypothetical protein
MKRAIYIGPLREGEDFFLNFGITGSARLMVGTRNHFWFNCDGTDPDDVWVIRGKDIYFPMDP